MAKIRLGFSERPEGLPLVWAFLRGQYADVFTVEVFPADRVGTLLRQGVVDCALVGSCECATGEREPAGLEPVTDLCVAATLGAPTLRLRRSRPLPSTPRVDLRSPCAMTSRVARAVLRGSWGEFSEVRSGVSRSESAEADARLVGDFSEIPVDAEGEVSDLGALWCAGAGGPAVLQHWTRRADVPASLVEFYLRSSLRYGLASLESIAREVAAATGGDRHRVERWYRETYRYFLGEEFELLRARTLEASSGGSDHGAPLRRQQRGNAS